MSGGWVTTQSIREQTGLRRSEWKWFKRGRERKFERALGGLVYWITDEDYAAMVAAVAERVAKFPPREPFDLNAGQSSEAVASLLGVSEYRFKAAAKRLGFKYERRQVAWHGRPVRWHLTEDQIAALRDALAPSDSARNVARRARYAEQRTEKLRA